MSYCILILCVFVYKNVGQTCCSGMITSSNGMSLSVEIDDVEGVYIESVSPTFGDAWSGWGFGSSTMTGTYAIICDISDNFYLGDFGATEVVLGNHARQHNNISLDSSLTVAECVDGNGYIKRPRLGLSSNHYTFPLTAQTINVITAYGTSKYET